MRTLTTGGVGVRIRRASFAFQSSLLLVSLIAVAPAVVCLAFRQQEYMNRRIGDVLEKSMA